MGKPVIHFKLKDKDGMVLTSNRAEKFWRTVVKPYLTIASESYGFTVHTVQKKHTANDLTRKTSASPHYLFGKWKMLECQELMDLGLFNIVLASEARNNCILRLAFVDSIRHEEKSHALEKFQLKLQAYNDKDHGYLTYDPIVQRASQRWRLELSAMDAGLQFFARDVSPVYVYYEAVTQRLIFVRPPDVLYLSLYFAVQVEKKFYGISEAGMPWHQTYHSHHSERLSLITPIRDPSFLYTKAVMLRGASENAIPRGLPCLRNDDTASCGSEVLLQKKSKMEPSFEWKPAKILINENKFLFNGTSSSLKDEIYAITMCDHIENVQKSDWSHVKKPSIVT